MPISDSAFLVAQHAQAKVAEARKNNQFQQNAMMNNLLEHNKQLEDQQLADQKASNEAQLAELQVQLILQFGDCKVITTVGQVWQIVVMELLGKVQCPLHIFNNG